MTSSIPRSLLYAFGAALLLAVAQPTGASQLTDPPSAGKILYYFTGVRTSDQVSTIVHCTNLDPKKDATLELDYFQFNGSLFGSGSISIASGVTRTVSVGTTSESNGGTAVFAEDLTVNVGTDLNQGTARVSADGTSKIICTGQLIDRVNNPPTFAVELTHWLPNAKH